MIRPTEATRRLARQLAPWLVVLALGLRLLLPVLHGPDCDHGSPTSAGSELATIAASCDCCADDEGPTPRVRAEHRHGGFCAVCELQLATPGAPLTLAVSAPPIEATRAAPGADSASAPRQRRIDVPPARAPPRLQPLTSLPS